MTGSTKQRRRRGMALATLIMASVGGGATYAAPTGNAPAGLKLVSELKVPALETEVSGLYPYKDKPDWYFVVANKNPAYREGQSPKLPVAYRGKLLVVNGRSGEIMKSFDLGGAQYGGIAYGNGHLYVSNLEPPEILEVEPNNGKILRHFAIEGPAGGLEFDAQKQQLLAQLYLQHPHLAVIDVKSGATVSTLASDESAMDLKLVAGDLLCTWVSGFDKHAFSELRRIDRTTGKVLARVRLDKVHSSMAPLSGDEFLSLVTLDSESGSVAVRRYAYDKKAASHW